MGEPCFGNGAPRGRREPPPGDLVPGEGDVTHTARGRAAKAKPPRSPGRAIGPRASPTAAEAPCSSNSPATSCVTRFRYFTSPCLSDYSFLKMILITHPCRVAVRFPGTGEALSRPVRALQAGECFPRAPGLALVISVLPHSRVGVKA